ncbi:hypothetical protein Tco_1338478 [Tanacetum coccineum]
MSVQARENLMKSIQTFLKKFDRISFRETPKVLLLDWEKFFEIKHAFKEKQHQPEDIQELLHKLLKDFQMISEELADYINTPNWNCPAFYEDDDEEYTIAITPVLPIEEPDNSLSMGDEHLSTIPETELDELIKSSVENLIPIPSESEDFYDIENTLIISSPKFDSLLEEFSGELAHIELISPEIDEADFDPEEEIRLVEKLLYDNSSPRPPEEFNSENSDAIIESFSPSPIPVEDRDILFLEELLSNDSPSLHENESFHFDVPPSLRPPAKPSDDGIYFEHDTSNWYKYMKMDKRKDKTDTNEHENERGRKIRSRRRSRLLWTNPGPLGGPVWDEKQIKPWSFLELVLQLSNDSQTINEILKQRKEKHIEREQAANLAVQKEKEEQTAQSFTPYWKFPIIDDDEEYTIQFKEYLENSSKAITPDLPIEEPDNSLSMGDEHLSTIPETEMKSDKLIKSSVEDLIPIPTLNLTPSIPFVLEYPSFSPIPVVDSEFLIEEVDTFLVSEDSIPPGIESDFDSEGDIIFLNDLLNDDPIPEYEHFTFDIEPDTAVINTFDELNEDECFNPGGGEIVFPQMLKMTIPSHLMKARLRFSLPFAPSWTT